ncbi:alpha/beta fold hydrolase [Salinarimonas sp.]|uniref:thioesterase II family protein n=1 Tax=Salinarimonas sp. TaxID=2766526 RepID=UPI0032D95CF2
MSSERLRLFLFPYAGGSPSVFGEWGPLVPGWLALSPIEVPGGYLDPPDLSILDMAESAAAAIARSPDEPFALLGHSMGALVAFETARILQRDGRRSARHLFVCAHGAPHLESSGAVRHDLPAAEFDAELRRLSGTPREVLENDEMMKIVRPRLRRDFKACATYRFAPGAPLQIPVDALGGMGDAEAPEETLAAWRRHTSAEFRLQMFAGGHFFINEQMSLVVRYVARRITDRRRDDHNFYG